MSVLGAVAVLVPVLWVTGGLRETPKQPVKQAGKALDLGLFTVTVRDARIGRVDGGIGSRRERFLIVRMRVVNKGRETESLGIGGLADGVVALAKSGTWVKPEQVKGVAAGTETSRVQPGLPVEASAMWKLNPADSPEKLTVGLRGWKYEHGFTDDDFNWVVQRKDDGLVGRLTLPVAAMSAVPRPSPRTTRSLAARSPAARSPAARSPAARPRTSARPTAPTRAVPPTAVPSPGPTASRR